MGDVERPERIAIIGGGIAGLCAGIYAQRCGFRTTVFESQQQAGGVCAYWRRGPYLMEAGLQTLIGVTPASPFHELLDEVGVIGHVAFADMAEFQRVEDAHGEQLVIYRDPALLAEQLLRAGPRDRERVQRFMGVLEDFSRFRPPAAVCPETASLLDGLRAAWSLRPIVRHAVRYWRMPLARWCAGFESAAIREAFTKLFATPDFPVMAVFAALGWFTGGQVGRPALGSFEVVNAIESAYLRSGGDLQCGRPVQRILVESDRAAGVRCADGTEHRADIVIGAADGRATIFELLGGRYANDALRGYYRDLPVFPPLVIMHWGVAMPITRDPHHIDFAIDPPIDVLGRPLRSLNVYHSTGRTGAAPEGHCVVRVAFETEYEPWAALAREPARYREAKERLAAAVVERLEQRHPGFARNVAASDVATPVTLERLTHNWKGAYEGWLPTTRTFSLSLPKKLPGLRNFYMAGQWVAPGGGVPGVLRSARTTLMLLCKDFGRKFTPR